MRFGDCCPLCRCFFQRRAMAFSKLILCSKKFFLMDFVLARCSTPQSCRGVSIRFDFQLCSVACRNSFVSTPLASSHLLPACNEVWLCCNLCCHLGHFGRTMGPGLKNSLLSTRRWNRYGAVHILHNQFFEDFRPL